MCKFCNHYFFIEYQKFENHSNYVSCNKYNFCVINIEPFELKFTNISGQLRIITVFITKTYGKTCLMYIFFHSPIIVQLPIILNKVRIKTAIDDQNMLYIIIIFVFLFKTVYFSPK